MRQEPGKFDPAFALRALNASEGFIGDPKSGELRAADDAPKTTYPTSWFPTGTLARAWLALTNGSD